MIPDKPDVSRRRFLRTVGETGAAAAGMNLLPPSSFAGSPAPQSELPVTSNIFVGSRRQLMFDDFFVGVGDNLHESIPYGIRWSLGKVRKSTTVSFFNITEPWHDTTAWFNVIYENGRYRMWYSAGKPPGNGLFVCYAESDDGLTWRKPILGLIEKNGSKNNNIVYTGGPGGWHVEMGNVFYDPAGSPDERYKMIYPTWQGAPGQDGVTLGAVSNDGLHWTRSRTIFIGRYCDSQNAATYDPNIGKYIAYVRWGGDLYGAVEVGKHQVRGSSRGRSVARMESDDYQRWTFPEVVLSPDFEDGLNLQFYGPSYSEYAEADYAYFMFPAGYHIREGTFRPQVAVSRDNRSWMRPTRETFIPGGPMGAFDDHIISVCPGILPAGKDLKVLYYRSANVPHPGSLQEYVDKGHPSRQGMGRVEFQRDRIVGIESGADGGSFWTRPLVFDGRRLVVNVEPTGPDAHLEVQLIGVGTGSDAPKWARGDGTKDAPCPGHTFEDSIAITEDGLDALVKWKEKSEVGEWAGKPVRLHFRLHSMRLYAFQFVA